jgi:hypothetical protein
MREWGEAAFGTDPACDRAGRVAAATAVRTMTMPGLFLILSTPVRMREDVFVIVIGSMAGVEVKEFSTSRQANNHYRRLVSSLRMSADMPLDLVLIEDETDYVPLRKRFDQAHEQRVAVQRPARAPPPHHDSLLRRIGATMSGLLT